MFLIFLLLICLIIIILFSLGSSSLPVLHFYNILFVKQDEELKIYEYVTEWDLGGFPAWLLAKQPALKLRSSDPEYLKMVCLGVP